MKNLISLKKPSPIDWTHHPTCYRYDHHLIRIFQFHFCLGCMSGLLGIGLAILFYSQCDLTKSTSVSIFLCCLGLLIPTIIQPFFQKKWFKLISRSMLGFSTIIYTLQILSIPKFTLTNILTSLFFTVLMIVIFFKLTKWRKLHTPNPCHQCPHGSYPNCFHELNLYQKKLTEDQKQLSITEIPFNLKRNTDRTYF